MEKGNTGNRMYYAADGNKPPPIERPSYLSLKPDVPVMNDGQMDLPNFATLNSLAQEFHTLQHQVLPAVAASDGKYLR